MKKGNNRILLKFTCLEKKKCCSQCFPDKNYKYKGDCKTFAQCCDHAHITYIDKGALLIFFFNQTIIESLGKTSEALELYNKSLLMDPSEKVVNENKITVLKRLGREQEALEWQQKWYQLQKNQK